ncbi:AraC family transcriptional regulator [Nocardioides sp. cx-169]|uniref:helix-turn-helix transcriptional regulator n=1 Tax=Nocardioides sp. cx-169 TaxID=2899080 RepID=UPI001E5CF08E|nr:AraC family transcriptional regulator [Nocardioides sp. cx-169]MCD4536525.1 AraC family transcriptional regulator [Nocardioides sp. cx-169]
MDRDGDVGALATWRTTDPGEAEAAVAAAYHVPNRLVLNSTDQSRFHMQLDEVRIASSSVGLLSFGAEARVLTGATSGFHVNLTLAGRAAGAGDGGPVQTAGAGEGLVYEPGAVTEASWFRGCRVLTLLLSRRAVERELESLLGHSVRAPLRPSPKATTDGLARALAPTVHLARMQLARPSPPAVLTTVARHLEALLVDSFLLEHPHSYRDEIDRAARTPTQTPVQRAAHLLEERPEHPWTTAALAQEVHLGVRALQQGFRRHYDCPPMTYLRRVRLRRTHEVLAAAIPGESTVQEVALRHGILHLGRFSVTYRKEYGESPSVTLARPEF